MNDMTGRECIEVIHSAANGVEPVNSEDLLKELVEETIINGSKNEHASKNGSGRLDEGKGKTRRTSKPKERVKLAKK